MKTIITFCFALALLVGCTEKANTSNAGDPVVGGIYLTLDEDGTYSASKVLALDDQAVHIRFYGNRFASMPEDLSSDSLISMFGHVPMAREGFMMDPPKLLKVEKVSEEELSGYRVYLEAMGQ